MRVLITRPQPDADLTAARLRAQGHEALVDPLLAVEPLPEAGLPPGPFDGVVLTSVNGARMLATRSERAEFAALPLYAVGHRTAAAAPPSFAQLRVAGGDGAALAERLRADFGPGSRLLHVAGEERAVDLAAALAPDGITVALFVIYRAVPATALTAAVTDALAAGRVDVAFHYSPRTAITFAGLALRAGLQPAIARMRHLCFSQNVAAPLRSVGAPAEVAAAPNEDALFALLER